ncbi:MAG: HlyC/CorC family transporter [Bacteroidales bacterium]|nr:HlyC/CorC family transporter [Candidatus Colicola equi]
MSTLLIFLFVAMGVSFLCSTLESVLMSTTLSFINLREEEGYAPAKRMKQYKTEPEVPLAAILSLNTIANTVGAAGVGQQANILFGSQWFGLVSAIVTLLILIFSEIIPKTFGTTYWKNLMGFTAGTIRILIVLMYPFVKLIHWISRLFPENEESTISREEVVALANVGEQEGVIEEDEKKIIRNVIRLDEIKASDVMTPRVVASIAPESMTLKDYYDCDDYDHFSRIPVYSDSPEYITGYVMRDDALEDLTEDHFSKTLGEIKRTIPQFNENMSIGDIFDQMLKEKSQIGIIIDEYGCFQGILTLEDVIETIFGLEIIDENDQFADMQQYARERWHQRQKRFRKPLLKGQKE